MSQCGNFLGLGFIADSACKGLDALAIAGGFNRDLSSIPFVLIRLRNITNSLGCTTRGADAVNMTLFLASCFRGVLNPCMTGCGNNRVVIRLCRVFIALMVGIAVSGAGRSNNGGFEGVLLCRNGFRVGVTTGLAGKRLNAVALVSRFRSYNAIVVAVSQSSNFLGFGVALVVSTGVGTNTLFSAGRSLGDLTIAPIMTQCRDNLGLGFVATIVSATISLYTIFITSSWLGNFAIIPSVTKGSNVFRLGMILVMSTGIGTNTLFGASRSLGDFTITPIMTQRRNNLGLGCAIARAGVDFNTSFVTGGFLRHNSSIPIMTKSINIIALFGQIFILVANVDGIALIITCRSNRVALVPSLLNKRNGFGASCAAILACIGHDTGFVNGSSLGDLAVVIAVWQLIGILTLVGQAGDLIALINGITLRGASWRNNFLDMVSLIQLWNFLGSSLATSLALEGFDTLFEVCGFLGDNTCIPIMSNCRNIIVVVVHTTPLVANVLVIAIGGARRLMFADGKGVGLRCFLLRVASRGVCALLNMCSHNRCNRLSRHSRIRSGVLTIARGIAVRCILVRVGSVAVIFVGVVLCLGILFVFLGCGILFVRSVFRHLCVCRSAVFAFRIAGFALTGFGFCRRCGCAVTLGTTARGSKCYRSRHRNGNCALRHTKFLTHCLNILLNLLFVVVLLRIF